MASHIARRKFLAALGYAAAALPLAMPRAGATLMLVCRRAAAAVKNNSLRLERPHPQLKHGSVM
jgi:hypothetical protein